MNLYNLDQERSILGWCLNKEGAKATYAWIQMKHKIDHPMVFYGRNNQLIYIAVDQLVANDMPIDIQSAADQMSKMSFKDTVALMSQMKGRGCSGMINILDNDVDMNDSVLAAVGGYAELVTLAQEYLPDSAAEGIMGSIRENYTKRKTVQHLQDTIDDLQKPGVISCDSTAELIDRINTLSEPKHQTHNISPLIDATLKRKEIVEDYLTALWPLKKMNECVPMRKSRMIVLAGPSGSGKSSLGAQCAATTAKEFGKGSVLYASIEMDRNEIANLLCAQESKTPVNTIEKGCMDSAQRNMVAGRVEELQISEGIEIMDFEHPTHRDVEVVAKSMAANGKLRLIVVDHLQILESTNSKHSEYEKLSLITRHLKTLAKSCNCVVLLLCQMNRKSMDSGYGKDGEVKKQNEPRMSDLRGSSSIEQDANAVIMIWNRSPLEDPTQHKTMCVVKNRTGNGGYIETHFNAATGQYFVQIDSDSL